MSADVRRVGPDEWAELRDVRLRALGDAPAAFASTHAREVAFDEHEWRRRIDQVWVSGGIGVVSARVLDAEGASDHLPLVVDLLVPSGV